MDKTKTGHTPTPWKFHIFDNVQRGRCFYFTGNGNKTICHIDSWEHDKHPQRPFAEHEANAEFVLRAVNSHDEMLEALKGIVGQFEGDWFEEAIKLGIDSFIVQARAVIAKAER